jgi:fumarate reductase subunit C
VNVRLYVWQRATAAILAPLVLVHLAVIFYATQKGLSATDILVRTRGSIAWATFYGLFVVAASVHAPIGLRTVLAEWTPLSGRASGVVAIVFGACIAIIGLRAVAAVVLP